MKKLSVIIVSYNVKYYLEQCLSSVQRAIEEVDADVYVVDNHSRDGTLEYLRPRFSHVNFIESNHNLGFSRANNIAISDSQSEYVLLLNPDTIVGENTIRRCLTFMDRHPDAGGCGVKMLMVNGTPAMESRRGVPDPLTAFYKMAGLCARFPNNKRLGHYYMGWLPWDNAQRIEVISGACCMLRRSALDKVGLLDEDFFMYGEDIDLSYRLLKDGFQNWYLPYTILHYKGESTHKSSFRYVHVFYDAMLIFLRKHYGHLSFFIGIPIKIAIYVKAFFALMSMIYNKTRKSLGFFQPNASIFTEYIFIGEQTAIRQCQRIARQNGLVGRFIVGNASTRPEGHLSELAGLNPKKEYQVVYDTNAYSYEQILSIFEKEPRANVGIGTYNRKTRIIITSKETYKL